MLRMKRARVERGWNQTTLAFHAGMSTADVSRIESGRMRPYPSQVERLSRALELDSARLLEEADTELAGRTA
jgi:ribosome-binding protein aMBF1 (putative translation factor)